MRWRTQPFGAKDGVVLAVTACLLLSGIDPHDRLTWWLEIFWVIGAIFMWALWLRHHRSTWTAFLLVAFHSIVLIVGGYYTYALVPIGEWIQHWTGDTRNDYDRFGHFMQGLAPAILWREVFLRHSIVRTRGWLFVIVNGMCLAFAAAFELLEFAAAMTLGDASWAYLGSQGDVWDAQWDLLWCVAGTNIALLFLAPLQNIELRRERARIEAAGVTRP